MFNKVFKTILGSRFSFPCLLSKDSLSCPIAGNCLRLQYTLSDQDIFNSGLELNLGTDVELQDLVIQ